MIERQVHHLRRLVDDLLDVSRITRGSLELTREPLAFDTIIAEGIELARPLVDQREHTLEVDVAPLLIVNGDATRLAQIVANLVMNATRYTEPCGRITVTAAREGDEIALRVRDTGVGMPADLVPVVFDSFTRGGRAIDRAAGGIGLGLAIVKSLTQMHGGRVAARSHGPGRGSEIEVALPALQSATAASEPAFRVPSPRTLHTAAGVLVVDDNRDAADLLAEALRLQGSTRSSPSIYSRRSSSPASTRRASHCSTSACRAWTASSSHAACSASIRALQLIAITGYGQLSDRERTQEAGFAKHLVKPVALDVVVPLVESLRRAD